MMDKPVLGILGGMGPMATVYFYELLTRHTLATRDAEHIDIVISARASTPDRTAYIIGKSSASPLPCLCSDALRLESYGANILAIPCNTSHYFFDEINKSVTIKVLNMVYDTVLLSKLVGGRRLGLMATEGAIEVGLYQNICKQLGITYIVPNLEHQRIVTKIIYEQVKSGKPVNMEDFNTVKSYFDQAGCDRIILGCTELSLLKRDNNLGNYLVDSLQVLVYRAIIECGKTPIGLPEEFSKLKEHYGNNIRQI